jgi:hypothetical protein
MAQRRVGPASLRDGPSEVDCVNAFPQPKESFAATLSRMPQFSPNSYVPEDFVSSVRAYEKELDAISRLKRKDGRPVFSGLGFYPEMGVDFFPLKHVRGIGRLYGMSMHEGELLTCSGFASTLGYNLNELLGRYEGSRPIARDLTEDHLNCVGEGLNPNKEWRLRQARIRIGLSIKSQEWRHWGRCHNWENLTFLPSISGDFKILESALGQKKLDYVFIKGTHGWRFHYEGQDKAKDLPHGIWARILDERFMADYAVAVVSFVDRPIVEVLKKRGYEVVHETDHGIYAPVSPLVKLSDESERKELGVRLYRSSADMFFIPRGDFTVLERQK